MITTDKRRDQLVSDSNYHTTKWFSEDLIAIEMKKTKVKMNKAILDLGKIVMHGFWYDYIKPKYGKKAKLCYMDTDSFIIHFYKNIADDVEKRFDTPNYECNRPSTKTKNKNVIGLMKEKL